MVLREFFAAFRAGIKLVGNPFGTTSAMGFLREEKQAIFFLDPKALKRNAPYDSYPSLRNFAGE